MITIKYEVNGQEIEIEVEDGVGKAYIEIQTETKREQEREKWRRRKKLTSIEEMAEHDVQIADGSMPIAEQLIEKEDNLTLHNAIAQLLPQQQELIRKVFFEGQSITAVAREYGIDKTSVRDRLKTIYKKIKKFL